MSTPDPPTPDEHDSYYGDTHPALRNAVVMTRGDKVEWFVPRADFEALAKQRDDLRRALALVNVALRIHDPRLTRMDPLKILDGVGQDFEQARATGSIMLNIQERAKKST